MSQKKTVEEVYCSFCGRTEEAVDKLISGPNVFICDKCVRLCMQIVDKKPSTPLKELNVLKPKEIKAKLDEYVVGQEEAKRTISVAVYNHYQRILAENEENPVELGKSNVLLLGPTGSGKTLIAKTLARILNVPFAIADATTLTEAGYVGEDVENIVLRLVQAADYDIESAQRGIIYIDEIDKIGRTTSNVSITRDVSGEGVQQALLKIIEGTSANIPPKGGRKHPHQEYIKVNTDNILFIAGGAFVDLDKVVARRIGQTTMGFASSARHQGGPAPSLSDTEKKNYFLSQVQPEDLVRFGMIPEFVGRFNCLVNCEELREEDLVSILTEPKNSLIKQYTALFQREEVKLTIEKPAIHAIAQKAMKTETGARALKTILERILRDTMYLVPSEEDVEEIILDEHHIKEDLPPEIRYRQHNETDEECIA